MISIQMNEDNLYILKDGKKIMIMDRDANLGDFYYAIIDLLKVLDIECETDLATGESDNN